MTSLLFEGYLGEALGDAIQGYKEPCKDNGLADDAKLIYFHTVFSGEALRFYRKNVDGVARSFREAVTMMQGNNSSHRRSTPASTGTGSHERAQTGRFRSA